MLPKNHKCRSRRRSGACNLMQFAGLDWGSSHIGAFVMAAVGMMDAAWVGSFGLIDGHSCSVL